MDGEENVDDIGEEGPGPGEYVPSQTIRGGDFIDSDGSDSPKGIKK